MDKNNQQQTRMKYKMSWGVCTQFLQSNVISRKLIVKQWLKQSVMLNQETLDNLQSLNSLRPSDAYMRQ